MSDEQIEAGLNAVGENYHVQRIARKRLIEFLSSQEGQLELRWKDSGQKPGPYAVDTFTRKAIAAIFGGKASG